MRFVRFTTEEQAVAALDAGEVSVGEGGSAMRIAEAEKGKARRPSNDTGSTSSGEMPPSHEYDPAAVQAVAAAARDVAATVAHACGPDAPTPSEPTALLADGTAPLVLGHSFGGKVGLAYAAARDEPPIRTWLFDSNPTITTGAGGVGEVLAILEDAARDQVYSTKKAAVEALVARGLEPATAQWLAMTTAQGEGGVRFSYDLDAVRALYDDHCQTDLLPEARALDDADRLGLVIAGKADVVPRDLGLKHTYLLEESGHNVHVDALPELLDVVVGTHGADWVY